MISDQLLPEELVSSNQTGFISNHFIGENTRFLYDTITYCTNENIAGLLGVVDNAKAFDKIKWSYGNQCRQPFDFGEQFIEWITIRRKILRYKELPMYNPSSTYNSCLNIIVFLDNKGVSNIYILMIGRHKEASENLKTGPNR